MLIIEYFTIFIYLYYLIMKTVSNIFLNKSASIYSVSPDSSVLDALQIMMYKNISALLVIERLQD